MTHRACVPPCAQPANQRPADFPSSAPVVVTRNGHHPSAQTKRASHVDWPPTLWIAKRRTHDPVSLLQERFHTVGLGSSTSAGDHQQLWPRPDVTAGIRESGSPRLTREFTRPSISSCRVSFAWPSRFSEPASPRGPGWSPSGQGRVMRRSSFTCRPLGCLQGTMGAAASDGPRASATRPARPASGRRRRPPSRLRRQARGICRGDRAALRKAQLAVAGVKPASKFQLVKIEISSPVSA